MKPLSDVNILRAIRAKKKKEMTFAKFHDSVAKDPLFVALMYYLPYLSRPVHVGEMGVATIKDSTFIVIISELEEEVEDESIHERASR